MMLKGIGKATSLLFNGSFGPYVLHRSLQSSSQSKSTPPRKAFIPLVVMSKEIEEFYRRKALSEDDVRRRDERISGLQQMLLKAGLKVSLVPFGSSVSGLGVKGSDIDLVVGGEEVDQRKVLKKSQVLGILQRIRKVLKGKSTLIPKAKIPILKYFFNEKKKKIQFDISVGNYLGVANTQLIKKYVQHDNRLKFIYFIVRKWATEREIHGAPYNYISSYAYCIMVIHFLQKVDPPVLPCLQEIPPDTPPVFIHGWDCTVHNDLVWKSSNTMDVATLLMAFFKYYAKYDWKKTISIRSERSSSVMFPSALVIIEDPFEITHNLGKSVKPQNLAHIQREFERAYKILSHPRPSLSELLQD